MEDWRERVKRSLEASVKNEIDSGGAVRPMSAPSFETCVGSNLEVVGQDNVARYWMPGLNDSITYDDELALFAMYRGSVMRLQHHKMLADLCRNMAALEEIESDKEVQRVENEILDWCASPSTVAPKWAEWAEVFDSREPEEVEGE